MSYKKQKSGQKPRRSDYDTWKKTGRDQDGLLLVAEQKFLRLDTLGEWWAPGYAPAIDGPKSPKESLEQATSSNPSGKSARGGNRMATPWPSDKRHRMMATQRIVSRW